MYAVDRATGQVVIDENSALGMTPASCLKVLTTGAALHVLGKDHRFTTTLEHDGDIKNGFLHGNLYLRGGGDPCLGANDWEGQLRQWVNAVKVAGIQEIQGRVIGDASAWETAAAQPGWVWEDLGNYYGAGASALSFHENAYTMVLKPSDQVGGAVAIVATYPPQLDLEIRNELVTGPVGSGDQACIYGSEYAGLQVVRGSIPAGVDHFTIKGAIPDPSRYVEMMFAKALDQANVKLRNQPIAKKNRVVIHTTQSPTVAGIVRETNQRSMNLYAEHLLKAMGKGSTREGIKAVKEYWQSAGLDLSGANITDGSGLSRSNVLTAQHFVGILRHMEKSPHFDIFLSSLPSVQGTKAKVGTMSLVKGYVGYSDRLAFAFFINQCPDVTKKAAIIDRCFQKLRTLSINSECLVTEKNGR